MACELPEAGTVPCVCAAHRPPPPRGSISRGCSAEGREVTEGLTTLGTVDAGVVFSAPQGKEALVENQPPDSCRPDGWASRGVLNAFLLLVKNTDSAPPHASHFAVSPRGLGSGRGETFLATRWWEEGGHGC